MALYENLPVFKDTYQLLLQFMEMSRKLERDVRYSIGEQVKKDLIDLCVSIYRANANYEKIPHISEAREKLVVVRLQLRILLDMKQVNEKQHAILMDTLVGVSKQLSQWESYTKDKKKGTSGEDGAVCFESSDT